MGSTKRTEWCTTEQVPVQMHDRLTGVGSRIGHESEPRHSNLLALGHLPGDIHHLTEQCIVLARK
jgi:hypothetical protein